MRSGPVVRKSPPPACSPARADADDVGVVGVLLDGDPALSAGARPQRPPGTAPSLTRRRRLAASVRMAGHPLALLVLMAVGPSPHYRQPATPAEVFPHRSERPAEAAPTQKTARAWH